MRTRNVSTLIQRVYGRKYQLEPEHSLFAGPRYYLAKARPVVAIITEKRFQILLAILLTVMIAGSIYYFNLLVQTEQDVMAAMGKVDALQQRRNDISINLSKAVFNYSKHERSVFTAVVSLRSVLSQRSVKNPEMEAYLKKLEKTLQADVTDAKKMPAAGILGAGALSGWDRLMAVAEQYPDLKLSGNFQNLMTALIEVEKDLATERIQYNDMANLYTTTLFKFPTNFYAWAFGFKTLPYFEATSEAKRFKPIDY